MTEKPIDEDIVDQAHRAVAGGIVETKMVTDMILEIEQLRFELDCVREERDAARGDLACLRSNT